MRKMGLKRALALAAAAACLAAACGLAACSSSGGGDEPADGDAAEGSATEQSADEGASQDASEAVELRIYAADELSAVLPELQELYVEQNPQVSFADTLYDATESLAAQVAVDDDADLVLTSTTASMDDIEASIDPATRIELCSTDLVVVMAEGAGSELASVEDILSLEGSIGICDPNEAAVGLAALQALDEAGLAAYETDEDELVVELSWAGPLAEKIDLNSQDAESLAERIASGDLDAGFLYACDLDRFEGLEVVCTAEADSHRTIACSGAVLADSENPEAAADFMNFCLTDDEAQKILGNYGFDVLG